MPKSPEGGGEIKQKESPEVKKARLEADLADTISSIEEYKKELAELSAKTEPLNPAEELRVKGLPNTIAEATTERGRITAQLRRVRKALEKNTGSPDGSTEAPTPPPVDPEATTPRREEVVEPTFTDDLAGNKAKKLHLEGINKEKSARKVGLESQLAQLQRADDRKLEAEETLKGEIRKLTGEIAETSAEAKRLKQVIKTEEDRIKAGAQQKTPTQPEARTAIGAALQKAEVQGVVAAVAGEGDQAAGKTETAKPKKKRVTKKADAATAPAPTSDTPNPSATSKTEAVDVMADSKAAEREKRAAARAAAQKSGGTATEVPISKILRKGEVSKPIEPPPPPTPAKERLDISDFGEAHTLEEIVHLLTTAKGVNVGQALRMITPKMKAEAGKALALKQKIDAMDEKTAMADWEVTEKEMLELGKSMQEAVDSLGVHILTKSLSGALHRQLRELNGKKRAIASYQRDQQRKATDGPRPTKPVDKPVKANVPAKTAASKEAKNEEKGPYAPEKIPKLQAIFRNAREVTGKQISPELREAKACIKRMIKYADGSVAYLDQEDTEKFDNLDKFEAEVSAMVEKAKGKAPQENQKLENALDKDRKDKLNTLLGSLVDLKKELGELPDTLENEANNIEAMTAFLNGEDVDLRDEERFKLNNINGYVARVQALIEDAKDKGGDEEESKAPSIPTAKAKSNAPEASQKGTELRAEQVLASLEHQLETVQKRILVGEANLNGHARDLMGDQKVSKKEREAQRALWLNSPFAQKVRADKEEALRLERQIAQLRQDISEGKKTVTLNDLPVETRVKIAQGKSLLEQDYTKAELAALGIPQKEIDALFNSKGEKKEEGPLKPAERLAQIDQRLAEIDALLENGDSSQKIALEKERAELLKEKKALSVFIKKDGDEGKKEASDEDRIAWIDRKLAEIEQAINNREKILDRTGIDKLKALIAKKEELIKEKRALQGRENPKSEIGKINAMRMGKGERPNVQPQSPEAASLNEKIAQCKSFDELFAALRAAGEIPAPKVSFTAEEMCQIIDGIRKGAFPIEFVPAGALRDKVQELLGTDKTPPSQERDLRKELEDARAAYIAAHNKFIKERKKKGLLGKIWSKLQGVKPQDTAAERNDPELEAARARYEAAKAAIGQQMWDAKKEAIERKELTADEKGFLGEELKVTEPDQTIEYYNRRKAQIEAGDLNEREKDLLLKNYRAGTIFPELVLNERQLLLQGQAETWPPKAKNVFQKGVDFLFSGKTSARVVRTLMVATVMAVPVGLSGGLAVAGLFAGKRFVSSMLMVPIMTPIALGMSKVYDGIFRDKSQEELEVARRSIQSRYGRGVINTEQSELDLQSAHERAEKQARNRRLIKTGVLMLVGAGVGVGANQLMQGNLEGLFNRNGGGTPTPEGGVPTNAGQPTAESVRSTDIVPATPDSTGAPTTDQLTPEQIEDITRGTEQPAPTVDAYKFEPDDLHIEVGKVAGDNLWKIIENKMMDLDDFKGLTSAQKVGAIDDIYQQYVRMNPDQLREIGIASGNVHKIAEGAVLDLSKGMEVSKIHHAMDYARGLDTQSLEHIDHNVKIVRDWAAAHPRTAITERLVNKLIAQANH